MLEDLSGWNDMQLRAEQLIEKMDELKKLIIKHGHPDAIVLPKEENELFECGEWVTSLIDLLT